MLEYYLNSLDALTIDKRLILLDMVECLRIKDGFFQEAVSLRGEIAFGDYFKYKIQRTSIDINTDDFANVVLDSCTTMHDVLLQRGLYDEEGKFHYEFSDFKNRLFFLRRS